MGTALPGFVWFALSNLVDVARCAWLPLCSAALAVIHRRRYVAAGSGIMADLDPLLFSQLARFGMLM